MMGGPGDHPVADLLEFGRHPFVPQIERLVRAIAAITPEALHDTKLRGATWFSWARGERLDDAIRLLSAKLRQLEQETGRPPSLKPSDYIAPSTLSSAASAVPPIQPDLL